MFEDDDDDTKDDESDETRVSIEERRTGDVIEAENAKENNRALAWITGSKRFSSQLLVCEEARRQDTVTRQQLGFSWRAACAECRLPPHMRNVRIMVLLIFNILLVTFVWLALGAKAYVDTLEEYVEHFTNWMWTFMAIYYTFDIVAMLMINRFFESVLLSWVWWIYFSNAMVVFWLVFIMLYDNPGILTDEFEENGGDTYAGTILDGDRVFHIIPELYGIIYFIARIPDFVDIFYIAFTPMDAESQAFPRVRYRKMVSNMIVYMVLLNCVACPLVILAYYNIFDIKYVYEVDTPVYLGVLIIFFTILSTNVAPILLLSPLGLPSRKQHLRSWTVSPYVPSQQDVDEYERSAANMKRFEREKKAERAKKSARRQY